MSRDIKKLSLDDQNKLHNKIMCVKGVLELIFAGLSGDLGTVNEDSVQLLIMDANSKLDEVMEYI